MTKINLEKLLTNLDGQPITDGGREMKMFHAVANALAQAKNQNAVKCYDLALRFYSGVPVELDDSDLALVRDIIEKADYYPLVKGPLLKELDAIKIAASHNGDK